MKNLSPFQIGLYVVFALGIVFAVLIFSGKIPIGQSSTTQTISGSVTVWGTLPQDAMSAVENSIRATYKQVNVEYVQQDPATFQADLVNALASGNGPDMVLLTPADIVANHDRLLEIPYASLPQAAFESTFTDQGQQFLTDTGVLAFPFVVDPMVMYYNKDMLTSSFTVNPPATWDDVVALNKKITQQDDAGKLSTETVALGSFDNITHAKDILANLIFQAGNPIVSWNPTLKTYISNFADTTGSGDSAVVDALTFYTDFANPNDAAHYSWNATLPDDKDQFIAGNLALYFGYASELPDIRAKNPNLNFDVAMMPQRSQSSFKSTYGQMTGVGILKLSKNISLDLLVAEQMVGQPAVSAYLGADSTYVPVRRDMLTGAVTDARQQLFYNSAIIAKSFLDPDADQTSALFKKFVDNINAGVTQPAAIISPGDSLLSGILEQVQKQTSGSSSQ